MPAGGNGKPSVGELLTGGLSSGGRIQRRHFSQSYTGAAAVALGVSVIVFASRSIARTRHESKMIKQMWHARTTVGSLRRTAERGERLPKVALVRGTLRARGAPVTSLAMESPQLRRLVGDIDQPPNEFLDQADLMDSGKEKLEGQKELMKRKVLLGSNLLLTELFITRLGCKATKEKKTDKYGNEEIEITRDARRARFNVLHHRRVADGLHIVGADGEKADLELPPVLGQSGGLASNESPSLFVSLPDAMNEFKNWLKQALVKAVFKTKTKKVINADKPLTHVSRFIHLDQRSKTDLGSFGDANDSTTALDDIGRIVPSGWHWNGKGFYDNREKSWQSHRGGGVFAWHDFKRKMREAAAENARYQEATRMTEKEMLASRDSENCFRVSELGISSGAVTVLGKPVHTGKGVKIVPPTVSQRSKWLATIPDMYVTKTTNPFVTETTKLGDTSDEWEPTSDEWEPTFSFRILKGHSIKELIEHRRGALRVYLGFAAMGLATVVAGEEMIRDCLEVTYM